MPNKLGLNELRHYSRMAAGVVQVQRERLPADPDAYLRERVLNREKSFLDIAGRVIFGNPDHPYRRMFHLAGCELGDLTTQVQRDGLEAVLLRLRREGVYLGHNEWKGKTPIVRGGREIPGSNRNFKNPLVSGWMRTTSSGSTGRPIETVRSSASLAHSGVYRVLRAREFGYRLGRSVWIDVKPILPSPGGLHNALRNRRTGVPVDHWFSFRSDFSWDGHYRLVTSGLVLLGNLFGARAPFPKYLPSNDFSPVAEFIARRRAEGRECFVHGFASPLVRVASVAIEKGYDISGTTFFCGGEALTLAKSLTFKRAGARGFSGYGISEIGNIGAACQAMEGSCVHIFEDAVAPIGYPRPAADPDDPEVNSLHFTTLAHHSPYVFINLEMDDEGVIEPATCDCTYSRVGLNRRINHISSFGKANPQGMTFHRTDLVEVLERAMPQQLGGGPGDYQLVECEARNGQTQLQLRVSPRAGVTDLGRVREAFMSIVLPRWGGALATQMWSFSDGIEVAIAEPIATSTGKVHPVRLLGAHRSGATTPRAEVTHAS
jgi:hypothetical protein